MEGLSQCDVAPVLVYIAQHDKWIDLVRHGYGPVGEWSDDKAWSIPQVLVGILEFCITNVTKAVSLVFIPPAHTEKQEPFT